MSGKRYTEEQVIYAVKQADAGTAVKEICRQLGVSEPTFYAWKKKYGGMGVSELRELRQLRDENQRLKRLVADLTLDKHIHQEVLSKKSETPAAAGTGQPGQRMVRSQRPPNLPAVRGFAVDVLLPEPCPEP